jgi:HPt (histidine-containing phosphotransfer) domain-containing protein
MDGYLTKPISSAELFGALSNLFPAPAANVHAPAAAAVRVPPPPPALDLAQLKSNMDDDEEMLQDIVGAFLRDHIAQLAHLRTALHTGDQPTALRAAHTMKGLLLTLAAQDAADVALTIEHAIRSSELATAAGLLPLFDSQLARLLPELQALQRRAA